MALNRLRFHNILVQDMDAPSVAATELAETVDEGITDATDNLATQRDIALAEARLREDIAKLNAGMHEEINRLLRWLIGLGVVLGAGLIGLIAALIAKL